MELVTVFTRTDVDTERFKVGANVRAADSDDIALNGFAVQVGDIRVSTGVSALSKTINTREWIRRFTGEEYQIQTIDDSVRGRRVLFARGT